MKTPALLILLVLCACPGVSAQILVGPVAGPQVSWVSYDDKDNRGLYRRIPVIGFHGGFGLSFRVNNRFFLHSALLYSAKGKKLQGKEDQLLRFKSRYHYIDFPMYYTVEFINKVGKLKQYKWYFGLGPHVSYWLGGKGHLENTQLSELLVERINYKIVYDKEPDTFSNNEMNVTTPNRFQLGLNLAAGLVFEPLGYQKVMVTVRYEAGHSFMSRDGTGAFNQTNEYTDDLRVRSQGFRVSFAYLIDLNTEESKKGKSTINRKKLR